MTFASRIFMAPLFRLFFAVGGGLGLVSCEEVADVAGPPARPPAKVVAATVEERLFADEVEALGTVRAYEAIDLSANVTEQLTEIHFEDGEIVEKGALLAKLSDNEERAMLEGARVNLAEQEREVKRMQELVGQGAVSQVRLQEYLTARDLALQKIEEAKAQLADRTITAPFAGVLGFRRISVGALVSPGDVIATLDLIDTVKLDFAVPETFLGDLSPQMVIQARSSAFPREVFEGTVTNIESRINPVTRSVMVRAEIPNPEAKLRAGMLLTTRVKKNPSTSPAIPERALVSVQTKHFAFLINETEEGTTVSRVPVGIGRRQPGYVEILDGLQTGQRVVSDGLIGLGDGAVVTVSGEFQGPAEPYTPSGGEEPLSPDQS